MITVHNNATRRTRRISPEDALALIAAFFCYGTSFKALSHRGLQYVEVSGASKETLTFFGPKVEMSLLYHAAVAYEQAMDAGNSTREKVWERLATRLGIAVNFFGYESRTRMTGYLANLSTDTQRAALLVAAGEVEDKGGQLDSTSLGELFTMVRACVA